MTVSVERLCLEESLADTPQTRNFVNVFQEDTELFRNFAAEYYGCCEDLYKAQRSVCNATRSINNVLKKYKTSSFPLDRDKGVQTATLAQFSIYLEEIGALQKTLAAQVFEYVLGPVNRFLSCDNEALNGMRNMYDMITDELDQSLARYLKLPKKASEQARLEAAEDVYQMRRKFHLSAMQYYASLNKVQYRRHTIFLDSLVGYVQTFRDFYSTASETLHKKDVSDFLTGVEENVKCINMEMNEESTKTESLIVSIDEQCTPLYNPELVLASDFIKPNPHLLQKSGYLLHRRSLRSVFSPERILSSNPSLLKRLVLEDKQSLLGPPRWSRLYFFTQGGNLMSQARNEVAGHLVIDLNEEGVFAEVTEIDERKNVFQIVSPLQKRNIILQAETEKERDEWVSTLTNVMFEGGFVRDTGSYKSTPTSSVSESNPESPVKRKPFGLNLFTRPTSQHSNEPVSGSSGVVDNRPAGSENPLPPGFLDATPIQFDLTTPVEERPPAAIGGSGATSVSRKNPFDEAQPQDHSSGDKESEQTFCKTFSVRFMGTVQVPNDRGESLVTEAIRHIMTSRAIHNIYRMADLLVEVSSHRLALLDPSTRVPRQEFSLEDVAFWSTHHENSRLLAFITRRKSPDGPPVFNCHVFECHEDGKEVCNAIRTATKVAFQELTRKRAHADKRAQETSEKELLLANISVLPDKVESMKVDPDAHNSAVSSMTGRGSDRATVGDGDERRVEGAECQNLP